MLIEYNGVFIINVYHFKISITVIVKQRIVQNIKANTFVSNLHLLWPVTRFKLAIITMARTTNIRKTLHIFELKMRKIQLFFKTS